MRMGENGGEWGEWLELIVIAAWRMQWKNEKMKNEYNEKMCLNDG